VGTTFCLGQRIDAHRGFSGDQYRKGAVTDTRITLPQSEIPRAWYNPLPDLPTPLAPPLDPETKEPLAPEKLEPIFPRGLIEQEMSGEREIAIPEEVRNTYSLWRPTPLIRAKRLEEAIGAKSRIYYKDESVSPTGSHKPNTAVAQAYFNKAAGISRLATETGAGQWGAALAFASRWWVWTALFTWCESASSKSPIAGS
jgi:tryptophan synthase beta chain